MTTKTMHTTVILESNHSYILRLLQHKHNATIGLDNTGLNYVLERLVDGNFLIIQRNALKHIIKTIARVTNTKNSVIVTCNFTKKEVGNFPSLTVFLQNLNHVFNQLQP